MSERDSTSRRLPCLKTMLSFALTVLAHSQIVMALSAAAFLWMTATLTGHMLDRQWYLLAFVGCWWVYLLDAGLFSVPAEDRENIPKRADFMKRYRPRLVILAVIALGGEIYALLSGPSFRPATVVFLVLIALVAGAYVFPIFGGRKRGRLKELALWKPVLISAVWLGGALGLSLLEGRGTHASQVPLFPLGGFLFLLLLGDSIMLDWRDRAGDGSAGIRTIPVRFGATVTISILMLSGAGATAIWYFTRDAPTWNATALAMVICYAISLVLIPIARRHGVLYYYAVAGWRFAGPATLLIFEVFVV